MVIYSFSHINQIAREFFTYQDKYDYWYVQFSFVIESIFFKLRQFWEILEFYLILLVKPVLILPGFKISVNMALYTWIFPSNPGPLRLWMIFV